MQELAEGAAKLPPPHKRPPPLQSLPSPALFTSVAPPPRLLLLNSIRRVGRQSATAPPLEALPAHASGGAGAGAGGSGSASAGAAPAPAPPLTRSPNVIALDEHLAWLGNTYYTSQEAGMACGQWALLRRTTLGRLTSPARESSPLDAWAPLEVAKFESALCLVGKQFPLVAKVIGTKTTKEVVEFYYLWKQSKNYAVWKEALCVCAALCCCCCCCFATRVGQPPLPSHPARSHRTTHTHHALPAVEAGCPGRRRSSPSRGAVAAGREGPAG